MIANFTGWLKWGDWVQITTPKSFYALAEVIGFTCKNLSIRYNRSGKWLEEMIPISWIKSIRKRIGRR